MSVFVSVSVHHLAKLLVLAAAIFLVSACGGSGSSSSPAPAPDPEFVEEGLNGRIINALYREGDRIFAATDAGIYSKGIDQDLWQLVALEDRRVVDLVFIDALTWIAATFKAGEQVFADPQLLETVNEGSNWQRVESSFGGAVNAEEAIFALYFDSVNDILYATGTEALAVSNDRGRSWTLLSGLWQALSKPLDALNLNTPLDQVWYGGQNSVEQMTLRRFDLSTGETAEFPNLLANPATIKGITFDPDDNNKVIASGESGIAISTDNGATWSQPLGDVDFRFYFDVVLDPRDSTVLYTAGWDKGVSGPQPLILEVSTDGGSSFRSLEYQNPDLRGGALSLLATEQAGETIVYIGLDGGGIVKVLNPSAI